MTWTPAAAAIWRSISDEPNRPTTALLRAWDADECVGWYLLPGIYIWHSSEGWRCEATDRPPAKIEHRRLQWMDEDALHRLPPPPPDAFPQAHRLALELEALLLACGDTAAVSKWWDSAHEALEQWRQFCAVEPPAA